MTPRTPAWLLPAPYDAAPLAPELEPAPRPNRSPAAPQRVGRRQLALAGAGLTEVDRAVLRSLGTLTYLTTKQIERLCFHDDPRLSALTVARRARRRLARLHAAGIIDRLERRIGGERAGSAAYVWRLSPAGSRLLGGDRRRRTPEPGFQHLAHTLDVAEVVVRLHDRARATPVELIAVEAEPACWRRYVSPYGKKRWLKPDLRLTLRAAATDLHWFVEVDRGTEHRGPLTHKITSYVAAWRDRGEQTRAGVFPRVLWIVPTQARAALLQDLWTATPGVPGGMMAPALRTAAIDALVEPPR